jgi:hypothetical protein
MTREELLEYAALDAFGLLDEYEASLYTRSFHNAPAAVQDQILQLQAQLVSDESLLPSVNPDPTLRSRVLQAVAEAIEQETAQLEPLATIGRPRANAEVIAKIEPSAASHFWRAAAFALCAGLLVVAYFLNQVSVQQSRIAELALGQNTEARMAQLEELIGPTFKDYLFDANAKPVYFAARNSSGCKAVLYMVEGADKAFLVVENLAPAAEPYRLSVKDQAGNVEDVETFESSGKLAGVHVAVNRIRTRLTNVTWEISGPSGVLLASI